MGGSTGGYLLAASSPVMLDGTRTNANPISWKSGKLSRVARSSLSAEIQSFSEAEEELMYTRIFFFSMGRNAGRRSSYEKILRRV